MNFEKTPKKDKKKKKTKENEEKTIKEVVVAKKKKKYTNNSSIENEEAHTDGDYNHLLEGKKKKKRKVSILQEESQETPTDHLNESFGSPIKKQKKDKETPKKKKKKMKLKTEMVEEEETEMVEEEGEEIEEIQEVNERYPVLNLDARSSGKDEKKRKHWNVEDEELQDTEPSDTTESSEASPKKRKKNKSANMDETQLLSASHYMPKMKEPDNTPEHYKQILKLAIEQVKPSRKPYNNARFTNINFEVISHCLGVEISPDECQTLLKTLLDKTTKTKCLHQVLCDTLVELPSRNRGQNSFSYFISMNHAKIQEAMDAGRGPNKWAVASLLWQEITDSERATYGDRFMARNRSKNGMTPFDIYFKHLKKKDSHALPKDARLKYANMKMSKKKKYIESSLEIMQLHELERQAANDGGGGSQEAEIEKPSKLRGPTKDDTAQYFEFLGLPKEPAKIPHITYFKEMNRGEPCKNFLFEARKSYRELDPKHKRLWDLKHKAIVRKYEEELPEWRATQSEITMYWHNKIFGRSTIVRKRSEEKSKPKMKLETAIKGLRRIEMPVGAVKFSGEPSVPPLTPIQLYVKRVENTSKENLDTSKVKQHFGTLPPKEKAVLKDKSNTIREKYKEGLLSFVSSNMTEEQRKLFLGLRRIKYYKLLREDIFEEYFPNNEYPVYIRPPGRGKTLETKREVEGGGGGEEEEEEEVEEEEEEEEKEKEREQQQQQQQQPTMAQTDERHQFQEFLDSESENSGGDEDDDDDDLLAWGKPQPSRAAADSDSDSD